MSRTAQEKRKIEGFLCKIVQEKRKIEDFLRRKAHSDSAFSHLINFAFRFFSSGIVSAVTTIIGTVVIAAMTGRGYYGGLFFVTCGVYCLLTFLIGWATDYSEQKNRDARHLQNALKQLESVLSDWSIIKQSVAEKFQNIDVSIDVDKDRKAVEGALADIAFKNAARVVCKTLAEFLSNLDNSSRAYVTVYQRFKADDGISEYCKMIAYSTNYEPTSFPIEYPIPPDAPNPDGNIEFHSYIFASGNTGTIVLPDKEAVQTKFKAHKDPQDREADICQYVGIPIVPAGLGVAFLLQVDVSTPNLLGNSEDAVKEFSNNTIRPFAEFLHMIYEDRKLIEELLIRE